MEKEEPPGLEVHGCSQRWCRVSCRIDMKPFDNELNSISTRLKEPCHEDFAVLGQFCANIITLIIDKMLLQSYYDIK